MITIKKGPYRGMRGRVITASTTHVRLELEAQVRCRKPRGPGREEVSPVEREGRERRQAVYYRGEGAAGCLEPISCAAA